MDHLHSCICSNFYKLLNCPNLKSTKEYKDDENLDTYSLGEHLIDEHNCKLRSDFNDFYEIFILMNSSPTTLEINEHKFIHKLKTLKPFGINSSDPFGIPILHLKF